MNTIPQPYLRTIRQAFPDVSADDLDLNRDGLVNDVVIVGGETVFRFPRRDWAKAALRHEARVLDLVRGRLPVPVPSFDSLGESAVSYRYLPTPFHPTIRRAPSPDTRVMTLFEFTTEASVRSWKTENDVVMGGVSSSELTHVTDGPEGGGVGRFAGEVSLENDGGFAQILYDASRFDLSGYGGIELQVKGDGHTYQLRLETDAERVAYAQSFVAPDAWRRVRLPFTEFEATHHGEPVPDAPSLDLANIRTVGVLIGDGQEGAFELRIAEVRAYR